MSSHKNYRIYIVSLNQDKHIETSLFWEAGDSIGMSLAWLRLKTSFFVDRFKIFLFCK
jgi:hypothetical protein